MEKKIGPKILLSAFIIIICFSWLFWLLLGKFVDQENYENRELAVRPKLSINSYFSYSLEYEEYEFMDNFGLTASSMFS